MEKNGVKQQSKLEYFFINLISFLLIFGVAILVLWSQIHNHVFILGTDSNFHMNRFYEAAEQIKTGHFNYFMSIFSFYKSGRLINALYGPIMAYLSGFLLLISGSWYHFEIIDFLIELSLGGWFMYKLCVHNYIQRWACLLIAGLYVSSYPLTIWVTAQEFTGWGAVFLPLAMLCGTDMINHHRIKIIPLTLVMTILIQTHLVSGFIAILALIPFFIVSEFHSKNHLELITKGLQSVGLTLLLTGNIWGTIASIFTTNHIIPIYPQKNVVGNNVVTFTNWHLSYFGPIETILLLVTFVLLICHWKTCKYQVKTIFFIGVVFLWVSSNLFPWVTISKIMRPFTDIIQFPKRFVVIAVILTLLAFGKLISYPIPNFNWIKYVFTIMMMIFSIILSYNIINSECYLFNHNVIFNESTNLIHIYDHNPHTVKNYFYSHKLSKAINFSDKGTPDYLPSRRKVTDKVYYEIHPYHAEYDQYNYEQRDENFHKLLRNHNTLVTTFDNNSNKKHIIIPLSVYKQTKVVVNHHLIKHPHITNVGALRIHAKDGYNSVSAKFNPDKSNVFIMVITILSWGGLIVESLKKRLSR